MVIWLKRFEVRGHAKFGRNQSNCDRYMSIFRFFKTAAAAILDFQNLNFSTVGGFKSVELRRRAKFGRSRSNCCRDMAIFYFSKMAAVRHLGFVVWVFGPPTMGASCSLSLCKMWFESMQ